MGIKETSDTEITCDECERELDWGDKAVKLISHGWGNETVVCLPCLKIMMEKY